MGTRDVRYSDLSGTEDAVAPHEISLDRQHYELDLAAQEYRDLKKVLQPYIAAARAIAPPSADVTPVKSVRRSSAPRRAPAPSIRRPQRELGPT